MGGLMLSSNTSSVVAASRDEWLKARRDFITASDAAKILGLSKFGGAIDVYVDKTEPPQPDQSAPRAWLLGGQRFERTILEWYAEIEGCKIVFANPFEIVRSPDPALSRIGATLDAQRCDSTPWAPVDAKLIDRPQPREWGEPGSDAMPLYYAVQLVIQMHVTGAPFAELAVRFPSQAPVGFRLWRDLETEAQIVGRCQEFYENHITARVRPPVDGSESYERYLKNMLRQQTDRVVEATDELNTAAMRRAGLDVQIEALEESKRECDNILKSAIGEGKSLVGDCWRATWNTDRDSMGPDYEAIALVCAMDALRESVAREMRDADRSVTDDAIDAETEKLAREHVANLEKTHTKVTRRGARKFLFRFTGE